MGQPNKKQICAIDKINDVKNTERSVAGILGDIISDVPTPELGDQPEKPENLSSSKGCATDNKEARKANLGEPIPRSSSPTTPGPSMSVITTQPSPNNDGGENSRTQKSVEEPHGEYLPQKVGLGKHKTPTKALREQLCLVLGIKILVSIRYFSIDEAQQLQLPRKVVEK